MPFFFDVPFVWVAVALVVWRELRFTGSGVGGAASLLTRDDFRTPFSNTVVGPSAAKAFQGGDMARDADRLGVLSSSFRRFAGCWMTPPSSPFSTTSCSSSFTTGAVSSSTASASCAVQVALRDGNDVGIGGRDFFHSVR
jgi:hypothetical protein